MFVVITRATTKNYKDFFLYTIDKILKKKKIQKRNREIGNKTESK